MTLRHLFDLYNQKFVSFHQFLIAALVAVLAVIFLRICIAFI